MFKLESYITPILLSYVNKYIKNFRPEDSQVSLWGGEASFLNLDLRLEVLEHELQLPFNFVSGHIHELLIHVPWTKLASEPITITINTIECILKLKGSSPPGSDSTSSTNLGRETRKSKTLNKQEIVTPPGYIHSLVNKIVGNISIVCKNLILKYVEEDIVVSMNIKLLKFESANDKWQSAFTDIPTGQVFLRKLINLTDLTICLDKRNAAGKIDVYQEPMLYRCSMEMRLFRCYHTATATKISTTRLDIYCNRMEFSMTEQQVPMLIRLILLLSALQGKQFKDEMDRNTSEDDNSVNLNDVLGDTDNSWAGWAWSFVPAILPVSFENDDDECQFPGFRGHTLHLGFYVDVATFTFKVSEYIREHGGYPVRKLKYWPMLNLEIFDAVVDTRTHGYGWSNCRFGLSSATLSPVGYCACGTSEIPETVEPLLYLKIGTQCSEYHKDDSLFDPNSPENQNQRRLYNVSWDYHVMVTTETVLLEKSPGFVMDYLYELELPEDCASEKLSELGSDLEYSNLVEHTLCRFVCGPLELNVCSGLFHRFNSLKQAADVYDYPPYAIPTPDPSIDDLPQPTEDDLNALINYIPTRTYQITFFKPRIRFQLMDHVYFLPSKGNLFRKHRKTSYQNKIKNTDIIPELIMECQCLDAKIVNPIYPQRLVITACCIPNIHEQIFNACYSQKSLKILAATGTIQLKNNHVSFLSPTNISYSKKNILKEQYWLKSDIPHIDRQLTIDNITCEVTKPNIILATCILYSIYCQNDDIYFNVVNSSLIKDAIKTIEMPKVKIITDNIKWRYVSTITTVSHEFTIGSSKGYVLDPLQHCVLKYQGTEKKIKDCNQVLILSGSQSTDELFLSSLFQYSINPNNQVHPSIIMFKLTKIKFIIDPLLYKWLIYQPTFANINENVAGMLFHRKRSSSEIAAVETPRRISNPPESVHSSSDRDYHNSIPPLRSQSSVPRDMDNVLDNSTTSSDWCSMMSDFYERWGNALWSGEISECVIYFPYKSLSNIEVETIEQALAKCNTEKLNLEMIVFKLSHASVRSATQKHNLKHDFNSFPVKLLETVWIPNKNSFPWTLSIVDVSCHTLQKRKELYFLKDVSCNMTVSVSTKQTESNKEDCVGSSIDRKPGLPNILHQSKYQKLFNTVAFYIHIDTTPINISIFEEQIFLMATIFYNLLDSAVSFIPNMNIKRKVVADNSVATSLLSPSISQSILEETPSNSDNKQIQEAAREDEDNLKISAWFQWTIARFKLKLYTQKNIETEPVLLKLVLDSEDIMMSLDLQRIYMKLKCKIACASILHFVKHMNKQDWEPGPFLGIIMQGREGTTRDEHGGFFSATLTRASRVHTYTKWQTTQKKSNVKSLNKSQSLRYITEMVVSMQPVDFILSAVTLGSYLAILDPLLHTSLSTQSVKQPSSKSVNNYNFPLLYLDCKDIRVIFPASELVNKLNTHDVCVLQLNSISTMPEAENPISRTPMRPDIYQRAAQRGTLFVPGSDIEDRQYQFTVTAVSLSTGHWQELEPILTLESNIASNLHTMNENPALEWNNLERGKLSVIPHINLLYIIKRFDVCVVIAPAIFYNNELVCVHAVEINCISDIEFNINTSQIRLLSTLAAEMYSVMQSIEDSDIRKKIIQSINIINKSEFDSGLEMADFSSDATAFKDTPFSTVVDSNTSNTQIQNSIPLDLFVTGGTISVSLYQSEQKYFLKNSSNTSGYEASEEDSQEEVIQISRKIQPLLYVSISQPNIFISKVHYGQQMKFSCYDFEIKISSLNHYIKDVPMKEDFTIQIIETKPGDPDLNTGIPPAFLTIVLSKNISKMNNVEVIVARPTKIYFSIMRWTYLLSIYEKVFENLHPFFKLSSEPTKVLTISRNHDYKNETYKKFSLIKEKLGSISNVSIQLTQLIIALETKTGSEAVFGCGKIKSQLTVNNRPERVNGSLSVESLTLGANKKMLLNPWSFSINVCLFWESWQTASSDPQLRLAAESECIIIEVGPEHIRSLNTVIDECNQIINHFSGDEDDFPLRDVPTTPIAPIKDQYYKDDLRAGAFQFVNIDIPEDLPLPYQVLFTRYPEPAMIWRYPQPRILAKVRVFPVPFVDSDECTEHKVFCRLEYWIDSRAAYQPLVHFQLSESEMCQLELPPLSLCPAIASTWRVVLFTPNDDSSNESEPLSPQLLAACIRVDSYFNPMLVPKAQLSLSLSAIHVSFCNHFDKTRPYVMPEPLDVFDIDNSIPENHFFLNASLENITVHVALWNLHQLVLEMDSSFKSDCLDYTFLSQQPFVESFSSRLHISLWNKLYVNLLTKPINIRFGPSVGHTLGVALQMWKQDTDSERLEIIIMTRYVICNNTNAVLRFGQVDTDEDVFLSTKGSHLYCWRSQKSKQLIRIGLERGEWVWSEPFSIDEFGTQVCTIEKSDVTIIVTVKSLSSTQKQVTFNGRLIVCNMLQEQLYVKVLSTKAESRELEFKTAPVYLISKKSSHPSFVMSTDTELMLRVRYYGLDAAWSGDIPLIENTKCSQPWLVKVPLQDRGQFLSIWCRVIVQKIGKVKRILAMLWPLFMIRSNLPAAVKVNIETSILNISIDTTIKGYGEYQQLYCPGTTDHSHQLTLKLGSNSSYSNQYIPMNYSLINQKEFFKIPEEKDIDEILLAIKEYDKNDWPFVKELNGIEWISDDQLLTHAQVRYQNLCKHSSTLLIEISPWCLVLNTLGCSVAIVSHRKEICRVSNNGITTPCKVEGTFNLAINCENIWYPSALLQFSNPDWNRSFYMPKIKGLIPHNGHMTTTVDCNTKISNVLISSDEYHDMKIFRISATHVISNQSEQNLYVICLATSTSDNGKKYNLDNKILDKGMFVPSLIKKGNVGIPIHLWNLFGSNAANEFALYIVLCSEKQLILSCPIRVDKPIFRRSVAIVKNNEPIPLIINVQENQGQMTITINDDTRPQLLIKNKSQYQIMCAESSSDGNVINETEHFNWMCGVNGQCEMYYTMPSVNSAFMDNNTNFTPKIIIALSRNSEDKTLEWSHPIAVTNTEKQYVRMPQMTDLKITVHVQYYTAFVIIDPISQVDISAGDIRSRLSLHDSSSKEDQENNLAVCEYKTTQQDILIPTVSSDKKSIVPTQNISKIDLSRSLAPFHNEILNSDMYMNHKSILQFNFKNSDTTPGLEANVYFNSIMFTLVEDGINPDASEVAVLTCDNVCISLSRSENINVNATVSDIQIDNQLYHCGGYDFPVVLIGEKEKTEPDIKFSLAIPINQLFKDVRKDPLVVIDLTMESRKTTDKTINEINKLRIKTQSFRAYIEDNYIYKLIEYSSKFVPSNFILVPKPFNSGIKSNFITIPEPIILEAAILARPLTIRDLVIEPIYATVSVHASVKLYIALDNSPLQFNLFTRRNMITTPYRLGHALTMHYLSGAIFGAGWVVGSLEILGSPGGLARSVGTGLRDFVHLPYQGFLQGPWGFLVGVTQGSASLMKHVTAGTLNSVTRLAASVARNLDRLTLDNEHLIRTEELRRQRPCGITEGFTQGLTGLGISILGAVGGLAHHPLQSMVADGASPRALVAGVGRGLVGVITKPLSGAADLLARTGQGLLHGSGWDPSPQPRIVPLQKETARNSVMKYAWKFLAISYMCDILYVAEATATAYGSYEAVTLVLTSDALIVVSADEDSLQRVFFLSELADPIISTTDPTLLSFELIQRPEPIEMPESPQMSAETRARITDYIRSAGGIQSDQSDPGSSDSGGQKSESTFQFYVNPQSRNYFITLMSLIKRQKQKKGFPLL